jgi:hypothetical protein
MNPITKMTRWMDGLRISLARDRRAGDLRRVRKLRDISRQQGKKSKADFCQLLARCMLPHSYDKPNQKDDALVERGSPQPST